MVVDKDSGREHPAEHGDGEERTAFDLEIVLAALAVHAAVAMSNVEAGQRMSSAVPAS